MPPCAHAGSALAAVNMNPNITVARMCCAPGCTGPKLPKLRRVCYLSDWVGGPPCNQLRCAGVSATACQGRAGLGAVGLIYQTSRAIYPPPSAKGDARRRESLAQSARRSAVVKKWTNLIVLENQQLRKLTKVARRFRQDYPAVGAAIGDQKCETRLTRLSKQPCLPRTNGASRRFVWSAPRSRIGKSPRAPPAAIRSRTTTSPKSS